MAANWDEFANWVGTQPIHVKEILLEGNTHTRGSFLQRELSEVKDSKTYGQVAEKLTARIQSLSKWGLWERGSVDASINKLKAVVLTVFICLWIYQYQACDRNK